MIHFLHLQIITSELYSLSATHRLRIMQRSSCCGKYKFAKGSLFCFSVKNWEAVKLCKCVNEPLCCSNSPVPSLKGPQLLCKLPTSIVPLSAGLYLTLLLLHVNTAQKSPTALLVPKKSPTHLAWGLCMQ